MARRLGRCVLNEKTIEPDYYRNNGTDLIEMWSKLFSVDGFRTAMKSHIMKYVVRYDQKNKIEDLEKAKYYIERLIEFEHDKLNESN